MGKFPARRFPGVKKEPFSRFGGISISDLLFPSSLDRNTIQFSQYREKLKRMGLSAKKGILFYGPPGTGKTHTLHYLAGALDGHTTLLIAAEQVALLSEYMTLARGRSGEADQTVFPGTSCL